MKVTVFTSQAIEVLEKNFAAHQEEYKQQLAGWQDKMKSFTGEVTKWAADGGSEWKRPAQPHKPQKFDKTYTRLLGMLKRHVETRIAFEDHEYDQIFLDKFNWKNQFASNSSLYTGNLLSVQDDDDDGPFGD